MKKQKKIFISIIFVMCLFVTILLSIFNFDGIVNPPDIHNNLPEISGSLFNDTINGYDGSFSREKFMEEFKDTYVSLKKPENAKFQYYFHDKNISILVKDGGFEKEYTYVLSDNFIL